MCFVPYPCCYTFSARLTKTCLSYSQSGLFFPLVHLKQKQKRGDNFIDDLKHTLFIKLYILLDILQLWTVVVEEAGRGKSEVDAKPRGSTCFSFSLFFAYSEALYATILSEYYSRNNYQHPQTSLFLVCI